MKTWDILTGCCNESYKIQHQSYFHSDADVQLIGNRLIVVWYEWPGKIHVWDTEKGRVQIMEADNIFQGGLRISGDGSRVFDIDEEYIQAWSLQTGQSTGKERLENKYYLDPLRMDGSKVFVQSEESLAQGWDFGVPGSIPIQFSEIASSRPQLNLIDVRRWTKVQKGSPVRIEDSITGKEVFQLCGKYGNPTAIQWDGQYLVAGYGSGEVLILDFKDVLT